MNKKPIGGVILGIVLLAVTLLLCLDVTAALEERFLGETGRNVIAANSMLAVFLIGLAIGVPAGILLFFSYMVYRERRRAQQNLVLEGTEPSFGPFIEKDEFFFSPSDQFAGADQPEEPIESFDPWEKPADWWKHAEDDA